MPCSDSVCVERRPAIAELHLWQTRLLWPTLPVPRLPHAPAVPLTRLARPLRPPNTGKCAKRACWRAAAVHWPQACWPMLLPRLRGAQRAFGRSEETRSADQQWLHSVRQWPECAWHCWVEESVLKDEWDWGFFFFFSQWLFKTCCSFNNNIDWISKPGMLMKIEMVIHYYYYYLSFFFFVENKILPLKHLFHIDSTTKSLLFQWENEVTKPQTKEHALFQKKKNKKRFCFFF